MGNTGAGKSSLINALLYGVDKLQDDEKGRLDVVDAPTTVNGQPKFKIGHAATSET